MAKPAPSLRASASSRAARGPAPRTRIRRLNASPPSARPKSSRAGEQQRQREAHRVEQVGAPEGHRRKQEEDQGEQKHAERHRHHQPRRGEPHRAQGVDPVGADPDHGELEHDREGEQMRQPLDVGRIGGAADLPQPQQPPRLPRREQQQEVDHAQQQHAVGDIMFEQPDQGARRLAECKVCRQGLSVAQIDKESVKGRCFPSGAGRGGVWREYEITVMRISKTRARETRSRSC